MGLTPSQLLAARPDLGRAVCFISKDRMADTMETTLQDLEARIDNLEMKITYQDDVIEALNKVIIKQWSGLEQFQRRIDGLEKRLLEARDNVDQDPREEPPPPHY
ncbi:MAG: SlyX family protein [Hyphomicrobiaceae bacterium]